MITLSRMQGRTVSMPVFTQRFPGHPCAPPTSVVWDWCVYTQCRHGDQGRAAAVCPRTEELGASLLAGLSALRPFLEQQAVLQDRPRAGQACSGAASCLICRSLPGGEGPGRYHPAGSGVQTGAPDRGANVQDSELGQSTAAY